MRIAAMYRLFNAELFLSQSIASIYDHVDRILLSLSMRPWNGPAVPIDSTWRILREFPDPASKIVSMESDWRICEDGGSGNEVMQTNACINFIRSQMPGITHVLLIDYDELYHGHHLENLKRAIIERPQIQIFRGSWRCYWKSLHWWIDPIEPSHPIVAFKMTPDMRFNNAREVAGRPEYVLPENDFIIHHFSYALPAEMVQAKVRAWSHAKDVNHGWFQNVWMRWNSDRSMKNLHPTNPWCYQKAVPADASQLPAPMKDHPFFGRDII